VPGLPPTLEEQLMANQVNPNYFRLFTKNNQEGLIWKRQLNEQEKRQFVNEEMWTKEGPFLPKDMSWNDHCEIRYGDTVLLQHVNTGLLTCPFIVRRVEDKCIAMTENHGRASADAVSQLHKLAFELKDKPGKFMTITDEEMGNIGLVSGKNTSHYSPSTKRSKILNEFGFRDADDSDDYDASTVKGKKRSVFTRKENVGEFAVWTIVGTGI
jgi:hypothetical protein